MSALLNRYWGSGIALVMLWLVSGIIVLAAHGGFTALAINWSTPSDPSGAASAILIELAPISDQTAAAQASLPIASPEKVEPEEKPEPEKVEPKAEEKTVEPPPPEKADVTLPREPPPPEKKPPPKKVKIATAVERAENVAPRQKALTAGVANNNRNSAQSYAVSIIRPHVLRFIANAKYEEGVVVVNFTITRQGRLLSRHVDKSSGHSELDNEALATLQRAQPFPPPPPDLTDQQFTFTLPMRYNIR